MTGLMLVILLGAMEQTVVAVAAPAITTQLHGFELIAWVVSAYILASTVATPIYGRLSDIYGRRAILTAAIALFFLASTGCALAQTMPQLIAFRILQGMGGGGLISAAQATIADVVPLRERGRYQGYISGVFAFASLAGPMVGGYLTHYLSWRWIFWINLPLAILAMAVVRRSLRYLPVVRAARRIDYIGAVLFAAGLTTFLIAVTRTGQGAAATSPSNIALLMSAFIVLALFAWHEKRTAEPLIPLSLLSNRTVAICCAALFICFFQFISMAVLLPLRLQIAGGAAADEAALRLLPLTLSIPLGAFFAGRMMSRTGRYKPYHLGGAIVAALGAFALSFITSEQTVAMAIVMGLMGTGIGFQFPTALVATQNSVPPSQIGVATAMTSLSRLLGGAIGVALLTSILLALLRGVADSISVESLRAAVMEKPATHEAVETAFRHLFLVSAWVSVIPPLLVAKLNEQELRGRPR